MVDPGFSNSRAERPALAIVAGQLPRKGGLSLRRVSLETVLLETVSLKAVSLETVFCLRGTLRFLTELIHAGGVQPVEPRPKGFTQIVFFTTNHILSDLDEKLLGMPRTLI